MIFGRIDLVLCLHIIKSDIDFITCTAHSDQRNTSKENLYLILVDIGYVILATMICHCDFAPHDIGYGR